MRATRFWLFQVINLLYGSSIINYCFLFYKKVSGGIHTLNIDKGGSLDSKFKFVFQYIKCHTDIIC